LIRSSIREIGKDSSCIRSEILLFKYALVTLRCCRSNLYIDGVLTVNNDFFQTAYQRCGAAAVTLKPGNHTLYAEGWSANAMLSITATYQGPDTLNMQFAIPGPAPCLPYSPGAGDNNFVICGYNSDSSLNMAAISHFYTYFNQVCAVMVRCSDEFLCF
jgi:hypothetical protein